jgi:hypothetical protein
MTKAKKPTYTKGAVTTARKVPGKPFRPGPDWTGNAAGRPKGSKHRLSEEFVAALCEDFERHGIAVIERVRSEKPADYLRVIASVIPREITVNPSPLEDMSDDELLDNLAIVRGLMDGRLTRPKPRNSGGSSSVN